MNVRWLTACVLAVACGDSGSGGAARPPPGDCPTPSSTGALTGACNVKPELSCQYGHIDCGSPISSGRPTYYRCVEGEWRHTPTPGSCPPPGGSGGGGNGGAGKGGIAGKGGMAGTGGGSTECPAPVGFGVLEGDCDVNPDLTCRYGNVDCFGGGSAPVYYRCVDLMWLRTSSGTCPGVGGAGGTGGTTGEGGEGGEGLVSSAGAAGEGGSP